MVEQIFNNQFTILIMYICTLQTFVKVIFLKSIRKICRIKCHDSSTITGSDI